MGAAADNLAAYLADPNCILLVAERKGEPVGQIVGHVLRRWDSRRPMLFLYSIDVAEGCRRQGVARALMEAFKGIGRESGFGDAFVFTNESNHPAMRLYEAMGGSRPDPDTVMFEWEDGERA